LGRSALWQIFEQAEGASEQNGEVAHLDILIAIEPIFEEVKCRILLRDFEARMSDTRNRIAGILIGTAAGDRNGGPIQMAIRVAESLVAQNGLDLADISDRYLTWWLEGAFDTGPVTEKVLELVHLGLPFEEASHAVHEELGGFTAGCNAAHRVAPLAMCVELTNETLGTAALQEAALTHMHPLAGDVSAAVVLLCRFLALGSPWQEAVNEAAVGRMDETKLALAGALESELDRGGFAPDALAAAIFFVGNASSFAEALTRSMAFAGHANYCPVLVGAIAGARWGRNAISGELLEHVDGHTLQRVVEASGLLSGGW
jgi:ADP-ribosyl-[dinitrogen reductase] hydrolase